MKNNYKIGLQYGDPSCDGHGMSETDYYATNYKLSTIEKAHTLADTKYTLGFEDVCREYGESTMDQETIAKFKTAGICIGDYVELDEDDSNSKYVHDFTGLYLAVAKLELPCLECEFLMEDAECTDIGGYGLFEN